MSQNNKPVVVGLGEVLWDCFEGSRLPGGAPANVAFQASQLGCLGIVCSRVGRDALGDELLAFLQGQGLRTDWIQRDPMRPTGTVTVDATSPDHPRYTIHEDVAWDHLQFDAALEDLAGQADAICFGTLARRSRRSRETIHRAVQSARSACLIVYDVNLRQHYYEREWIEQSLRMAHVVKLNAEEVIEIDKLLEFESRDQEHFASTVRDRYGIDTVCVTRTERGCLLVAPEGTIEDPGRPVRVADTVGAGDAFTAALIFAWLRAWPLAAQASFANAAGALVASRSGAMPPLGEELARLVAEYP